MTTIQLTQFKGYTKEMVYQYLLQCWPCFYTIVLPKLSDLEQGRDEILFDMLLASQLVNELRPPSREVLYSLPEPAKAGSFDFIVLTEDLESLAETIAFYANGLEDSLPTEELYDYVVREHARRDLETIAIPHYLQAGENLCLEDSVVDMSLYFE